MRTAWLLASLALAGCSADESCDQAAGASARIPFIGEPPSEAVIREVLAERGWTLDAPTGVAARRSLDAGAVAVAPTASDDLAHPGLVFSSDVARKDDVAAAELLAPVVEPVAVGLTERTARPYEPVYAGGSGCAPA